MPLTDDEFVKNGKLEGYTEIIDKLHAQEDKLPEMIYEFDDEDEEDQ